MSVDFEQLDPELGLAEELLTPGRALNEVHSALPDDTAATRLLNTILADSGATPRLRRDGTGWRLVTLAATHVPDEVAAAATALAHLVAADGWHRVKRCAMSHCATGFVDRTNAASRRYCRDHSRHPPPGLTAAVRSGAT